MSARRTLVLFAGVRGPQPRSSLSPAARRRAAAAAP